MRTGCQNNMAMESVDSFKLELEKFVALVEASKGSKML